MNRVSLIRTKFTDLRSGDENYGYRIYDDYAQEYSMFPDNTKPKEDDGEFLKDVSNGCPSGVTEMIDWAMEHGMYIDDVWYGAEEIQNLLK